MNSALFITSNKTMFGDMVYTFELEKITDDFSKGSSFDLLLVKDNKILSAITLTHLIDSNKDAYSRFIVINPVNCPNVNIDLGSIICAENITEWDKPLSESKFYNLTVPKFETKFVCGAGVSGDRICTNRTTPLLQKNYLDFITFSVVTTIDTFLGKQDIIALGIVTDHCTPNYFKLLQSNIKGLSSRMVQFIQTNLSVLLGD